MAFYFNMSVECAVNIYFILLKQVVFLNNVGGSSGLLYLILTMMS